MASNNPRCDQCGRETGSDAVMGLCPACMMKVGLGSDPGVPTRDATRAGAPAAPAGTRGAEIETVQALFPQLEILELIGRGGMGLVFKARQPKLDRVVALKILSVELAKTPGFSERFMREARALARLHHPNIVSVFEYGQQGTCYFLLMEYVDGSNLRQLIARREISSEAALALVPRICEALQFAHDEGVLHRDIKPENILVDQRGRVKIVDFGLAKIMGTEDEDTRLTLTGVKMGTPRYMAPEQVEDLREVDHRADLYSLGVVFYEMLTGELPMGRFRPPSQKVSVDVRVDDVVMKTLEKEPELRYQQASEIKTDVDGILRTPSPSAPLENVSTPASPSAPPVAVQSGLPAPVAVPLGEPLKTQVMETVETYDPAEVARVSPLQLLKKRQLFWYGLRTGLFGWSQILPLLLFILAVCAVYGAVMGIWNSSVLSVYVAIKLPLLFLGTAAIVSGFNWMIATALGSQLTFRQTVFIVVASLTIAAWILLAMSPIAFFVIKTAVPSLAAISAVDESYQREVHNILLLTHIGVLALAGVGGNVILFKGLRRTVYEGRRASALFAAWLMVFALVGCQASWILRPFIGSPLGGQAIEFMRSNCFTSNFYEFIFNEILLKNGNKTSGKGTP